MALMKLRSKLGNITIQNLEACDVNGSTHKILDLVQKTNYSSTIYFHGWAGLGAATVLRSIKQVLQSNKDHCREPYFNKTIYIDCSRWKSKRDMQRKIAKELQLDHKTMAMFEKQDKQDDLNGVNPASRDAIRDVAVVIDRTLKETSFMIIFLNGSDEEIALNRFGVLEFHDCITIWTFTRRFPTRTIGNEDNFFGEIASKLRHTDIFLYAEVKTISDFIALVHEVVHEEAANNLTHHPYLQEDDREIVIACYLYVLFLHHSFYNKRTTKLWTAHGTNYWICDGIIQGARAREISQALYQEVSFDCGDTRFYSSFMFKNDIMLLTDPSYMVFDDDYDDDPPWINGRRSRWISTTSNNLILRENMKNVLAGASSIFLPFEITSTPQGLPDGLMEQCKNLRVLILCNCAFNFSSPLFGHCSTLRFLGLDHCMNNYTSELDETNAKWAFLHLLWVLDMRYTDWDEMLSEEKIDLMGNIMELNIEGFMCWQYAVQLEGRLPCLQKLQIVKPSRQAEISKEIDGSFMGKTKLEVLNLSGNTDMKKLPTSISKCSRLQMLVLDGCSGLENVVLSNSLLSSFSFDGYGPASNCILMDEFPLHSFGQKCLANDDKKDVKTTMIILGGCIGLKNLFLRGLPNLVELDLSGCAIVILDFETMIVDVPRLKRLFLLGCEHLCEIRWGSPIDVSSINKDKVKVPVDLEFLYIDTRPSDMVPGCTRPYIPQEINKNFELHVHAVIPDARLARSLCAPIYCHARKSGNVFFDIRITSSSIIVCDEKAGEKHHVFAASPYDNISTMVGDSCFNRVQAFPQSMASQLDRHLEICDGSRNVESEMEFTFDPNLAFITQFVESVHVHDTTTNLAMPLFFGWSSIKSCRVERCPRLDYVFPQGANPGDLEMIWASSLLMARCIWSKGLPDDSSNFRGLRHLHLHSCPSLQFALPISSTTFPSLETLHVIRCASLTHVFALDKEEYNINSMIHFTKLTTIHLYDVSALRQICEAKMMAPMLETIQTSGCWNLRRLPALGLDAGERRRPTVEMEKDVWDALEWDGVDASHHSSLYKTLPHSRYYKSRRLLRGTVLR